MTIKSFDDGTKFVKALYWEDEDLKGTWIVTVKKDGVRVIKDKAGRAMSRDHKPFNHNLSKFCFKDAEFFFKDWNNSVSAARTMGKPSIEFTQDMFYELTDGEMDERLYLCTLENPKKGVITSLMEEQLRQGNEGIVLRQFRGNRWHWLKAVPLIFADVRIEDLKEGTGALKGSCGSIITRFGNVGSVVQQYTKGGAEIGNREFRDILWRNRLKCKGMIMQVGYRELTCTGKLRFATFYKLRVDKQTEDLPWLKGPKGE